MEAHFYLHVTRYQSFCIGKIGQISVALAMMCVGMCYMCSECYDIMSFVVQGTKEELTISNINSYHSALFCIILNHIHVTQDSIFITVARLWTG
jgi:hypothetical protein